MKINIAYPATAAQKRIDVDDEHKIRALADYRIAQEVEGHMFGDEYKGYIFKITGGQDKQGFAMRQGVLTNTRVRFLLKQGSVGFRGFGHRNGERRRKSVRGCIVGSDISVLNVIIVKKGDEEITGVTDVVVPRRLGPKRATKIRKLFNLSKEDDVRKYVIRRTLPAKEGKKAQTKAPKIQRLITPAVRRRKAKALAFKKERRQASKDAAAAYQKLLTQRIKAAREKRLSKKRASSNKRASQKKN